MIAALVGLCFVLGGVNVALVLWVRYLDGELADMRARGWS
jgi:hypothetical protein